MFAYLRNLLTQRRPSSAAKITRRARLDLELLERRETPATYSKLALDFGPLSSPVQKGFTGVNAGEYQARRGYGWVPSEGLSVVDRGGVDRLRRDFLQANDHSFKASVRKGWYQVTVWFGDADLARPAVDIRGEGTLVASIPATAAGEFTAHVFYARVVDGIFNFRFTAEAGRFAINALKLVKVSSPPATEPEPDPVNSNAPTATFGNSGAVNEGSTGTVSFTNVAGGSGGYKYSYDFDNNGTFEVTGVTNASYTVPKTYLADGPGSRTVRGRVTDSDGAFSDYTTTISINNVAPSVTLSNRTGTTTSAITFSATVSDPGVDTLTYLWNFGDGATSTAVSPSHQYAAIGTYTVTLKVTDSDGAATTKSATATISAPAPVGEVIDTGHDKIPNFGANPTIVAAATGSWSSPNTWDLGRVPQAGDIVAINNTFTVTYDVHSDAALNTVVINAGGKLIFRTDISTRLTVINFLVLEGGELRIGTQAQPVAANVKAEVIFANVPIDTSKDPSQYGNGLIALGKVTMHGAVKSDTFVRLAVEPKAGDTTLTLSQPVTGWRVGDRLVLADSRQLGWNERDNNFNPQWEILTIASISADGRILTLQSALDFDHLGARNGDGILEYLPHIGNLTRNVVVRSQSATGTRGHTFFTHRAEVDIHYAQFSGLGRTTNDPIDNTTQDATGNVTHIGTNQVGRYSVHFHHLMTESAPAAGQYRYTFLGNSVFCPLDPMPFKWGITVHGSDYGLIKDNVLYNWAGAGVVTEDGTEDFNVIESNLVVRISGNGASRADTGMVAREGSNFWFGGTNNYIRNNVAANGDLFGYTFFSGGPFLQFADNESYGGRRGLTMWYINGANTNYPIPHAPQSTILNFVSWHNWEHGVGLGYPSYNVTFDGLIVRGDKSKLDGIGWYFGDYLVQGGIIRNADIQGMRVGIEVPVKVGTSATEMNTFLIEDSYLRNYFNIQITTMWAVEGGGANMAARRTVIRNVTFATINNPLPVKDNSGNIVPQYAINMSFLPRPSAPGNWIQTDTVEVYDFNGNSSDDFRVYYHEQAADYIVPVTGDGHIGAPVAGLTNQEAWNLYGIAIAGGVAPSNCIVRPDVNGLVSPL